MTLTYLSGLREKKPVNFAQAAETAYVSDRVILSPC
jgi:hypothetical protein